MKTLNSYEHTLKTCAEHQVTGQELLNGRTWTKKHGWSKVTLKPEFREQVINDIVNLFGGINRTKNNIRRNLTHERRQHWGLDRVLLVKYGKNPARLTYCVGQDQNWENNVIRGALK
jgi:hypothetical protein